MTFLEIINEELKSKVFQGTRSSSMHWNLPPSGVSRLDVDASVRYLNQATYGGVVRDEFGSWIMGFEKSLNCMSIVEAELLAIKTGLEVCKQLKLEVIQVFSDSLEANNQILRDSRSSSSWMRVIQDIRNIIYGEWNVEVFHASREELQCAHMLAKEAQGGCPEINLLPEVIPSCRSCFFRDKSFVQPTIRLT